MNNRKLFQAIRNNLKKNGAQKIYVFGSYAKKKNKKKSDIDLLVEFSGRKSLLDLTRIERELSEKIDVKVDLLTPKSISPYIMESIKKEMIGICG